MVAQTEKYPRRENPLLFGFETLGRLFGGGIESYPAQLDQQRYDLLEAVEDGDGDGAVSIAEGMRRKILNIVASKVRRAREINEGIFTQGALCEGGWGLDNLTVRKLTTDALLVTVNATPRQIMMSSDPSRSYLEGRSLVALVDPDLTQLHRFSLTSILCDAGTSQQVGQESVHVSYAHNSSPSEVKVSSEGLTINDIGKGKPFKRKIQIVHP